MKGLNSHIFKWGNCSDAGPLAGKFAGISAPGAQPWGSRERVGSLTHILNQLPGSWVLEIRKSVMNCTASRTANVTGKSLNVNLRVLVESTRLPMQEI